MTTSNCHCAAVARPGDTIIIAMNRPVTEEDLVDIRRHFGYLFDQGIQFAVIEDAASMVVVKPKGVGDEV